ncbi:MAG: adenylate/guanylate cyclase domain-containing protein [Gammaproteobacteria bacterium]|nr:MAG: adenylate/guanylate cyclase domain-containing protein [Gammaproteobacteria bacterium]
MTRSEQTVAVLIADVCGSTPLYESSGNFKALDLIAECLDNITRVVESEGGTVLRSKGDDVLCTFPDSDSAVCAASGMMDSQAGSPLEIHVGIDYGAVVHDRGGIFGDVVNIAARMQSLAKPGEIITTEAVYEKLSDTLRRQVRLLDIQTVKGKSQPMNIYAVFKDDTHVTYYVGEDGKHTVHPKDMFKASGPKVNIILEFGDRTIVRRDGGPGFHIGRAESCDLVIDEPCVSRDHALLTVRRGKVLLTDMSSTGTWIVQADGVPILLRRDVMQLARDGVISLGLRPKENGPTMIRYRLEQEERHDD